MPSMKLFKKPFRMKKQSFAVRPVRRNPDFPVLDEDWVESIKQSDGGEKRLKPIIGYLMKSMRDSVDRDALARAYEDGRKEAVLAVLPFEEWETRWGQVLTMMMYMAMVVASNHERRRLALMSYPGAGRVMRRARADAQYVSMGVIEQTREAIGDLAEMLLGERRMSFAETQEFTAPSRRVPPDVAADITIDGLGMNRAQIRGYGKRVNNMIDEDRSPLDIQQDNAWYTTRQWDTRMEQMAKTQAMYAVNEGEYMAWEAAYEAGEFDRDKTWLYWIAIGDEKVCEECNALDGTRRKLHNDFGSPNGTFASHPPLHTGCRCVLTIREPASTYKRRKEAMLRERDIYDEIWEQDTGHYFDDPRGEYAQAYMDMVQEASDRIDETQARLDHLYDLVEDYRRRGESTSGLENEISRLMNEMNSALDDYAHLKNSRFQFFGELYRNDNPIGFNMPNPITDPDYRYSRRSPHRRADLRDNEEFEGIMDFIRSVLPDKGDPRYADIHIFQDDTTIPNHASGVHRRVDLGQSNEYSRILIRDSLFMDESKFTLVHEVGHWWQDEVGLDEDELSWFLTYLPQDSKTMNDAANVMVTGGSLPRLTVRTIEDYSRTVYRDGNTELFTTGLEHLAKDPARFQREAPEHYQFTLWVLDGRPRDSSGKRPWE